MSERKHDTTINKNEIRIEHGPTKNTIVTEALVRQYIQRELPGMLTEDEARYFISFAVGYNLNPLKREAYCYIIYKTVTDTLGNEKQIRVLHCGVGYEVFMKNAMRSGKLINWETRIKVHEILKEIYVEIEIERTDYRSTRGKTKKQTRMFFLHDYKQNTDMWRKHPKMMLEKVALARGFRHSFLLENDHLPLSVEEYIPQSEVPVTNNDPPSPHVQKQTHTSQVPSPGTTEHEVVSPTQTAGSLSTEPALHQTVKDTPSEVPPDALIPDSNEPELSLADKICQTGMLLEETVMEKVQNTENMMELEDDNDINPPLNTFLLPETSQSDTPTYIIEEQEPSPDPPEKQEKKSRGSGTPLLLPFLPDNQEKQIPKQESSSGPPFHNQTSNQNKAPAHHQKVIPRRLSTSADAMEKKRRVLMRLNFIKEFLTIKQLAYFSKLKRQTGEYTHEAYIRDLRRVRNLEKKIRKNQNQEDSTQTDNEDTSTIINDNPDAKKVDTLADTVKHEPEILDDNDCIPGFEEDPFHPNAEQPPRGVL